MTKKEYNQKTKLDVRTKFFVAMYSMLAILTLILGIRTNNFAWSVVSFLNITIAIDEHFNYKISRSKDMIIEMQDKLMKDIIELKENEDVKIR